MRTILGYTFASVLCLIFCCGIAWAEGGPLKLRNDKIALGLGQEERGGGGFRKGRRDPRARLDESRFERVGQPARKHGRGLRLLLRRPRGILYRR